MKLNRRSKKQNNGGFNKQQRRVKDKMTKYKCDICGKKNDKMHTMIECGHCYLQGFKTELSKKNKIIEGLKKELKKAQSK